MYYFISTNYKEIPEIRECPLVKETAKTVTIQMGMTQRRINKSEFENNGYYLGYSGIVCHDLVFGLEKVRGLKHDELIGLQNQIIKVRDQLYDTVEVFNKYQFKKKQKDMEEKGRCE